MTLKVELDNLDGLDDAVKSLYKQSDNGKFRLDVEDESAGLKSALQKEREARKSLEKAVNEGRMSQTELQAKLQELEEEKLKADGKTQELAARQAERMKAEFEKQAQEKQAALDAAINRAQAYEAKVFENQFRTAGAKLEDFHANAIDDAILRAKSMFKLDDSGQAVAMDAEGNVLYGKDGKSPLLPHEWLESMRDTAPHWFKAQSGSGTGGGGSGSAHKGNMGGSVEDRQAAIAAKYNLPIN